MARRRSLRMALAGVLIASLTGALGACSFSVATAIAGIDPIALTPRGNTRARFVRLRSRSGLDESLGSELAVW